VIRQGRWSTCDSEGPWHAACGQPTVTTVARVVAPAAMSAAEASTELVEYLPSAAASRLRSGFPQLTSLVLLNVIRILAKESMYQYVIQRSTSTN